MAFSNMGTQPSSKNGGISEFFQDRNPEDVVADLLSTQPKRLQTKKRTKKIEQKQGVKKNLSTLLSQCDIKNGSRKNSETSMESDQEEDHVSNDTSETMLQKRVRKNVDQIQALQVAYDKSEGNWTKKD